VEEEKPTIEISPSTTKSEPKSNPSSLVMKGKGKGMLKISGSPSGSMQRFSKNSCYGVRFSPNQSASMDRSSGCMGSISRGLAPRSGNLQKQVSVSNNNSLGRTSSSSLKLEKSRSTSPRTTGISPLGVALSGRGTGKVAGGKAAL